MLIESILTFSITVWWGSCTAEEKSALNRVVSSASRIIWLDLPVTFLTSNYSKLV